MPYSTRRESYRVLNDYARSDSRHGTRQRAPSPPSVSDFSHRVGNLTPRASSITGSSHSGSRPAWSTSILSYSSDEGDLTPTGSVLSYSGDGDSCHNYEAESDADASRVSAAAMDTRRWEYKVVSQADPHREWVHKTSPRRHGRYQVVTTTTTTTTTTRDPPDRLPLRAPEYQPGFSKSRRNAPDLPGYLDNGTSNITTGYRHVRVKVAQDGPTREFELLGPIKKVVLGDYSPTNSESNTTRHSPVSLKYFDDKSQARYSQARHPQARAADERSRPRQPRTLPSEDKRSVRRRDDGRVGWSRQDWGREHRGFPVSTSQSWEWESSGSESGGWNKRSSERDEKGGRSHVDGKCVSEY